MYKQFKCMTRILPSHPKIKSLVPVLREKIRTLMQRKRERRRRKRETKYDREWERVGEKERKRQEMKGRKKKVTKENTRKKRVAQAKKSNVRCLNENQCAIQLVSVYKSENIQEKEQKILAPPAIRVLQTVNKIPIAAKYSAVNQ